jgi:hypothetical protein
MTDPALTRRQARTTNREQRRELLLFERNLAASRRRTQRLVVRRVWAIRPLDITSSRSFDAD